MISGVFKSVSPVDNVEILPLCLKNRKNILKNSQKRLRTRLFISVALGRERERERERER
ncbi:hypothetical protein E2C01_101779 [Portunus trituberculatus]|uniref:Uncharacterized protein n=1 Tax=Portunus trituberculatus TaxID=210409 RepID=A0A5B7K6I8_PORTR|nr:hypothetical protein [Portunus trituberculatus]